MKKTKPLMSDVTSVRVEIDSDAYTVICMVKGQEVARHTMLMTSHGSARGAQKGELRDMFHSTEDEGGDDFDDDVDYEGEGLIEAIDDLQSAAFDVASNLWGLSEERGERDG